MPDNPVTADPSQRPRRRRFQFRLRTLLIVVALLGIACAYVAGQWATVRHRETMWAKISDLGGKEGLASFARGYSPLPKVRQWLGDIPKCVIELPGSARQADIDSIQLAFPEAHLLIMPPGVRLDGQIWLEE